MKYVPKFCPMCGNPIVFGDKFCPNCGNQLVANLYETTTIEPTNIEPTEIKPTEIKPTEIKPTEIKPTEIKPTEIKPTEIKPTNIEPTPIEPTPIVPGVFNSPFFQFFIHPNPLIFGLASLGLGITDIVLISYGGYQWWTTFFVLLTAGALFEVVWSFANTPSVDVNGNKSVPQKFKNWLGIKQEKSKMVKTIVGTSAGTLSIFTLIIFLLISIFSGFKNFIVLEGGIFERRISAYGYNPETDYERIEFLSGYRAILTNEVGGVIRFKGEGTYWRIGSDAGLKITKLLDGDWIWVTSGKDGGQWGYTPNFVIYSYYQLSDDLINPHWFYDRINP